VNRFTNSKVKILGGLINFSIPALAAEIKSVQMESDRSTKLVQSDVRFIQDGLKQEI